jgi:hypothetical protein
MIGISEEYKKQIQFLHSQEKFNSALVKYSSVKEFIEIYRPESILDYGCANGGLIEQIKKDFPTINPVDGFDPAVPKFEIIKEKSYDCVISNDVIEHIEPEFLDQTLRQIENLFESYAWLIIACYPAKKCLPDGRNAHLTVESPNWWIEKINNVFTNSSFLHREIVEFRPGQPELRIVLNKNV